MIGFEFSLRTDRIRRKLLLHPQELVNYSLGEVFQPLRKIDGAGNIVVVTRNSHLSKVGGHIPVVVVLKTEEIKRVETHLSEKHFRSQTSSSSVTVHERMDNYKLLMENSGENQRINVSLVVLNKRQQLLQKREHVYRVGRQIDHRTRHRIIHKHWLVAQSAGLMPGQQAFHHLSVDREKKSKIKLYLPFFQEAMEVFQRLMVVDDFLFAFPGILRLGLEDFFTSVRGKGLPSMLVEA